MRRLTAVAIFATCLIWICSCATRSPMSSVSSVFAPSAPSCTDLSKAPHTLPQHVFLIVLENESYDSIFGDNATEDPYLKGLVTPGHENGKADGVVLLTNYYAIGHNSLDNYIAMISGQPPNTMTQIDCPYFNEIVDHEELKGEAKHKIKERIQDRLRSFFHTPADDEVENDDEVEGTTVGSLELGVGCVYPPNIRTLADQFDAQKPSLPWRAYMEDMPEKCDRPEIGERDQTHQSWFKARVLKKRNPNNYAVRHNPFVYFESLIGKEGNDENSICKNNDLPLGDIDGKKPGLVQDLKHSEPFPNFVFISPNLCNDGHNVCNNLTKLGEIDFFLSQWVPKIRESKAYKDNGMIIITFDEAEVSTDKLNLDELRKNKEASKSCCGEKPGPFAEHPGLFGPGGGRIGAVIVSPLVQPGAQTNSNEFNHYSMLRSIEDMFGIHEHLGFANDDGLHTFQECGVFKPDPPVSSVANVR